MQESLSVVGELVVCGNAHLIVLSDLVGLEVGQISDSVKNKSEQQLTLANKLKVYLQPVLIVEINIVFVNILDALVDVIALKHLAFGMNVTQQEHEPRTVWHLALVHDLN